jgi:hypothetical protein
MSEKNEGQAFPTYLGNRENWDLGMSLRDYFAGQALIAIMSTELSVAAAADAGEKHGIGPREAIAKSAYDLADRMLEARKG